MCTLRTANYDADGGGVPAVRYTVPVVHCSLVLLLLYTVRTMYFVLVLLYSVRYIYDLSAEMMPMMMYSLPKIPRSRNRYQEREKQVPVCSYASLLWQLIQKNISSSQKR